MTGFWEVEAQKRGYVDEREMWKDLYPKHSLTQLQEMFGKKGINTIRDRLSKHQIEMRKRGGANNEKVHLDPELINKIAERGVMAIAKELGVKPSVIYQRLYYKYGLTVKELKAKQAALSEGDQPSSTSLPKPNHEPQV